MQSLAPGGKAVSFLGSLGEGPPDLEAQEVTWGLGCMATPEGGIDQAFGEGGVALAEGLVPSAGLGCVRPTRIT